MSTPTPTTPSTSGPLAGGAGAKVTKAVAAVVAIAALAFGASHISRSDGSAAATGGGGVPGMTQPAGAQGGGAPPGMGADVTGATLTKLQAAVKADYPGTVERALQLPDGSYVVHVIRSGGEAHVLVSKDFKVTGEDRNGPSGGGAPPSGRAPSGQGNSPRQSAPSAESESS